MCRDFNIILEVYGMTALTINLPLSEGFFGVSIIISVK
jgi:hypothetical protein